MIFQISHTRIAIQFALLLMLTAPGALAQEFTESGGLLGKSGIEVESGVEYERDSNDIESASGPKFLVRFGLFEQVEVVAEIPDYVKQTSDSELTRFGDAAIGAKVKLGTLGEWDVATMAVISIPVGATYFSSDGWDPSLLVTASRDLSKRLGLAGQTLVEVATDEEVLTWGASLVVLGALNQSGTVGSFLEIETAVPQGGKASAVLHHGYKYSLFNNVQLDIRGGAGLSDSAPKLFLGAGIILSR